MNIKLMLGKHHSGGASLNKKKDEKVKSHYINNALDGEK